MAITKSVPTRKIIHGNVVETTSVAIVSESYYETNGEDCIIVRGVPHSVIKLNSKTTDHITIKSMTNVELKCDVGLIDEEYEAIMMDRLVTIEFRFAGGNWYILSSDGLKQS